MDKELDKIINHIKEMNGNSSDINVRYFNIHKEKVAFMFLESVASDDKISNFLGKSLSINVRSKKNIFENLFDNINNTIPNSKVKIIDNYDDIFYHLASGFTCVFVDGYNKAITLETKALLDRSVTEATSEPVLKGPKDCFIENILANMGLIRKRIKDPNLYFEETKVGRRTKTKVIIGYIKDIADEEKVNLLKKKLEKINIDGIIDSNYIKELLTDNQKSFLPRVISTERPDLTAMGLLDGKIAIIVENTPYVLLLPTVFTDFFKSSEDYYTKPFNASFTRILRYIAFFIAILVPAFYIAVTTFNMEIVPSSLLISFSIQRESVPFPTIIEVLILVISYEILREADTRKPQIEADTRKPQIMGASISIVGALILGEAAVSAGVISPIVVIVISISAVSGMGFNDPDITNAIRTWRILFMLAACLFGIVGIVILFIIFITKLNSIEVLGTPYLAPLSPFSLKDFKNSLTRFPQQKIKTRPTYFNKKNINRIGSDK